MRLPVYTFSTPMIKVKSNNAARFIWVAKCSKNIELGVKGWT